MAVAAAAAVAVAVAVASAVAGRAAAAVPLGAALAAPVAPAPPALTLGVAGVVSQIGIPSLGVSPVPVKKRAASDTLLPPTHSAIRQTPWEQDSPIQGERCPGGSLLPGPETEATA